MKKVSFIAFIIALLFSFNAVSAQRGSQSQVSNLSQKELNDSLLAAQTAEQTALWLERGADPNARGSWGTAPIILAQTAEQTRLLLAAGADPNAQDWDGYSALHSANCAEQVKLLLEAGVNPNIKAMVVGSNPTDYVTPLMTLEQVEQIELLIKAGADVNYLNRSGYCPLRRAKSAEVTALLLKAEAIPDLCHDGYMTPLMEAYTAEQTRLLLAAGADPNAVAINISLIDADGNSTGTGITALFCAKTVEQTRMLLEAGADPNWASEHGIKAIDWVKLPEQRELLAKAMSKKR